MKKILIFNPYFYPGYKAGGPVQSLTHLVAQLGQVYQFAVVTAAFDLGETVPYSLPTDCWHTVTLANVSIPVWYAQKPLRYAAIQQRIAEQQPDIIYLNGIYGLPWFLLPLLLHHRGKTGHAQLLVCPRGMLQPGALAVKPWRKKAYLTALRLTGWCKQIRWHATTPEEAADIRHMMGKAVDVRVAANIPRLPVTRWTPADKQVGQLRLVYVSLITEKKNILGLIQAFRYCQRKVDLAIWGPIVDKSYWLQCTRWITQLPPQITVTYQGTVVPQQVQTTIAQYDALVLPTKGENFGHAIYESLSAARPVLISTFTPWQQLEERKAGWIMPISDSAEMARQIDGLADMPADAWADYCAGAYALAVHTLQQADTGNAYRALFDTTQPYETGTITTI